MRKKLFKYIKLLISTVLILGLVAPSYASLSASDGSAFVTKAEFDSALADFNSRLTTFEAGINSKIDSQVTSYLDRNGIWNGKKQTLNVQDVFVLWEDTRVTGTWTSQKSGVTYPLDTSNSLVTSTASIGYEGGTRWKRDVLWISDVSKSGMMIFEYEISNTNYDQKSGDNWQDLRNAWTFKYNGTDWGLPGGISLANGIHVLSGGSPTVCGEDDIWQAPIWGHMVNAQYHLLWPIAQKNSGMCFVSKGTSLWLRLDLSYQPMNANTKDLWNSKINANYGKKMGVAVFLSNARVY